MSVILYDDEKFLKIYQSLYVRGSDLAHLWNYPQGWDKPDGMNDHFKIFVSDLRRANIMAHNRQYSDDTRPISILDFHCVLPYGSTVQLLKSLQGLSYNLICNDGKEMNLSNCAKRLHDLTFHLMSKIINTLPEYERCSTW